MRRVVIAPVLLLTLSSATATDGYRWEGAARIATSSRVVLRTYPDLPALQSAARAAGLRQSHIRGFSQRRGDICYVHIVDPRQCYRPEIAGHELLHCFYGNWHAGNGPRRPRLKGC